MQGSSTKKCGNPGGHWYRGASVWLVILRFAYLSAIWSCVGLSSCGQVTGMVGSVHAAEHSKWGLRCYSSGPVIRRFQVSQVLNPGVVGYGKRLPFNKPTLGFWDCSTEERQRERLYRSDLEFWRYNKYFKTSMAITQQVRAFQAMTSMIKHLANLAKMPGPTGQAHDTSDSSQFRHYV